MKRVLPVGFLFAVVLTGTGGYAAPSPVPIPTPTATATPTSTPTPASTPTPRVRPAHEVVFTTGFAGSNVPVHTVVTVVPSPLPSGIAGQNAYFTERSSGQTFVPLFAHYQVTDLPSPWQLYVTGGLAANANTGKMLYGLSLGVDDRAFITVGWHSTTVDMLQPGLAPNGFTPYSTFPAGVSPTFAQRTTRPFVSLTFPLCSIVSIFSGLGQTCPSTPTPKPTPTSTPTPTPTPSPTPAAR